MRDSHKLAAADLLGVSFGLLKPLVNDEGPADGDDIVVPALTEGLRVYASCK